MTTKLKRCPFCKSRPFKIHDEDAIGCCCIGDDGRVDFTTEQWNTRPLEKQARLDALQECFKVCQKVGKETLEDSTSYCAIKIQLLIDKEKGDL